MFIDDINRIMHGLYQSIHANNPVIIGYDDNSHLIFAPIGRNVVQVKREEPSYLTKTLNFNFSTLDLSKYTDLQQLAFTVKRKLDEPTKKEVEK